MCSSMAPRTEPLVSPVITPVEGASPYPTQPVFVWISTITSFTCVTVLSAVLNGVLRGTDKSPVLICVIFIRSLLSPESKSCRRT